MPFAYVTEPGAMVGKRGATLIIQKEGTTLAEWELIHLDALVLLGPVHVTTPAMTALLRAGVETAFLSMSGRLIGQLTPPKPGNVQVRMAQYRLANDPKKRLQHARAVVEAKTKAMVDVLQRYADNYPDLPLAEPRESLRRATAAVRQAADLSSLRGAEGNAASRYWKSFQLLNRSELPFRGRSCHPPRDPVNALLSLGYVLLVNELWSLLDALGLDPFLGFYHQVKPHQPSLALDLVEPFRHHVVDRMVLRAINLGRFQADDFQQRGDGGVLLQRCALKTFIAEYERSVNSVASNPDDRSRNTWRVTMRLRCETLMRTLASRTKETPEPSGTEHCFSGMELDEPEEQP
jgi:CRISPR-associated endonuclease Cas1